jgi:hypothetical protein
MPQVLPSDLSKIFLAKGSLRYQTEKGSLRPIIERSLRHERGHLDCRSGMSGKAESTLPSTMEQA